MAHTQPTSSVPKQVVTNCNKMNTRGSFLCRLRKTLSDCHILSLSQQCATRPLTPAGNKMFLNSIIFNNLLQISCIHCVTGTLHHYFTMYLLNQVSGQTCRFTKYPKNVPSCMCHHIQYRKYNTVLLVAYCQYCDCISA